MGKKVRKQQKNKREEEKENENEKKQTCEPRAESKQRDKLPWDNKQWMDGQDAYVVYTCWCSGCGTPV